MKRLLIILPIVAIIAAVAFLILQGSPRTAQAEPTPMEQTADGQGILPPIQANGQVVADAVVVPVHHADLSLPVGGVVAEILVDEGQAVLEGQVILRLKAAHEQASLAQAEANLRRAQAQLDELKAGSRSEEIVQAQAAVDAAQAALDRLEEGATTQEIAVAQAAVARAQASLQKAREGAHPQEIAAAEAELESVRAARDQAQANYDEVAWRGDIGRLPQSLELERATNEYKAALARLERLKQPATAGEIAVAQAQVAEALAQLDQVKAPARPSDLASAQAELRRAQAQLALVQAGPRPETLAAAEAEVASAQAALDQTQAGLADTELRAPFAGTIAELVPTVGERVSAGAAIVRLADLSQWQIETDDLTELQIVRVEEGAPVTVEFDALPGVKLPGHVLRIKPIGQSKQGDIVYTVVIAPARSDERLRWNMTAVVTIETQ